MNTFLYTFADQINIPGKNMYIVWFIKKKGETWLSELLATLNSWFNKC